MDQTNETAKASKASTKKPAPKSKTKDKNYIDHEDVKADKPAAPATAEPVDVVEITTEEVVRQEIAKLNLAESGINELKAEFSALTIPEGDKDALEKVKKAWNLVRSKRTGLEKKGLELRNNYKVITTGIHEEEKRLIKLLTPLEEDLYKKWKDVEDEAERKREAKKQEEEKRAMARVEELINSGMTMRDGFYTIGHGDDDDISMDVATLRSLPEDQYTKLVGRVKAKKVKIDEAAEQERQRKEKEANDLREQQEKLKKEQDELKRQQEQLQQQLEEVAKSRREQRHGSLLTAGFIPMHDKTYKFKTAIMEDEIRVMPEILDISGEEFVEKMQGYTSRIADENKQLNEYLKEQQEKKAAAELREKTIHADMAGLGLRWEHGTKSFLYTKGQGSTRLTLSELMAANEDEYVQKVDAARKQIEFINEEENKLEQQREADRKQKEADEEKERQAGLTDQQKYEEMLQSVHDVISNNLDVKKLKTKAYKIKLENTMKTLRVTLNTELGIKA